MYDTYSKGIQFPYVNVWSNLNDVGDPEKNKKMDR